MVNNPPGWHKKCTFPRETNAATVVWREKGNMSKAAIIRMSAVGIALWLVSVSARADIYVYQLPGGARIVTDHALSNRDYKLVRQSRTSKGVGALVSSRSIQYAMTDPSTYDRVIRRAAATHQIDAALIKAVMHVESAFNPHAVSHKGAQGLMQLMPATAERYGAVDLFDPAQNVRAGVLYLKDLQKLFKNNTRLVLAAYNAGENAVLRHRGIPPYNETQDYVKKVMKMHREYAVAMKPAERPDSAAIARNPVAAPATVVAAAPAPTGMAPAAPPADASAGLLPVSAIQPATPTASEKSL